MKARRSEQILAAFALAALACASPISAAEMPDTFRPPAELAGQFGKYKSLLQFDDGRTVKIPADWAKRREEIKRDWEREIGHWPPLIEKPDIEIISETNRENFIQRQIRIQVAPGLKTDGYLLLPKTAGRQAAVVVPYYEPESSIGVGKVPLRDFAYQLTKRGFVTLSIGSPGGDARKPELSSATCQPLHFLGYVAANCYNALAALPQVDPARIGIVGHSYGGKWAMFGACFYEKFACGVWSDPGIVFDESRANINYWEPWYLGNDPQQTREPGVITASNGRTGPYKRLYERGHDLHEVLALMAPRPFFVSGGAEDTPNRWEALNRVNEAYQLLVAPGRVGMSSRPKHDPTPESNEQIYRFFERFLAVSQ